MYTMLTTAVESGGELYGMRENREGNRQAHEHIYNTYTREYSFSTAE